MGHEMTGKSCRYNILDVYCLNHSNIVHLDIHYEYRDCRYVWHPFPASFSKICFLRNKVCIQLIVVSSWNGPRWAFPFGFECYGEHGQGHHLTLLSISMDTIALLQGIGHFMQLDWALVSLTTPGEFRTQARDKNSHFSTHLYLRAICARR